MKKKHWDFLYLSELTCPGVLIETFPADDHEQWDSQSILWDAVGSCWSSAEKIPTVISVKPLNKLLLLSVGLFKSTRHGNSRNSKIQDKEENIVDDHIKSICCHPSNDQGPYYSLQKEISLGLRITISLRMSF